ncbi:hypothetical protein TWF730_001243 [Orbilia blumenaviensis]|uniref:HIT-type domain-containing protein n=1 Tax=Orbilia blumenaviensis TaxID=1796055 RepID=A0AAV9VS22_9PEZI
MDSASLCSVCVEAQAKYTCPVCSARTCSLVCSKRHKLRASCEGQLRPSAFKSKSDLGRPSQVAADFGFLDSVQRALQRAADSQSPPSTHRDHRFDEICKARSLVILPAPPLSSRASQNRTRLTPPDNHIIWSVEWVINLNLESSNPIITTLELNENTTLNDAFQNHVLPSLSNPQFPASTNLNYHLRSVDPHSQAVSLLPQVAQDTLSNVLVNVTVLEFPTIQVSISRE